MIRAHPMGVATAVIAVAAVAATLLAAVDGAAVSQATGSDHAHAPARAALARCRTLGPEGPADPVCQAIWAAQRERFFGTPARRAPASPGEAPR